MRDPGSVAGELTEQIPALLARHNLPGLAVGICDRSGLLWSQGFGSTRSGGGDPVRTSTMFSVQSCSKMYAAVVVLAAAQRGLVELDRPVTGYLPEFTVNSDFESAPQEKITLRHLLSHTAGFTHEAPEGSNYLVGSKSFAAHCRSIASTWLRFPVGHHYEYSNLGIDLAGWAVSRAAGTPFCDLARQWIFEPLGLHRSTFDYRAIAGDADRAAGHDRQHKRLPVRIPMVPAGGLYASVDDACRFVQMHLRGGEPVLSASSFAEMYKIPFGAPGQLAGYGLGITIGSAGGRPVHGHNGGGLGFPADCCWDPEAGVGVVVLTNSVDHPMQGSLSARLLGDLAGPPPQAAPGPLPAEIFVPPGQLRGLTGEYVGRGGDTVTLAIGDSRLVFASKGSEQPARMTAASEFCLQADPGQRFRVLPGQDGRAGYLQNAHDGFTRYRNDADGHSAPDAGPDAQAFAVTASGAAAGAALLRHLPGGDALLDMPGEPGLHLTRMGPARCRSATGETLDLGQAPPTYASIALHPRPSPAGLLGQDRSGQPGRAR